MCHYFIIVIIVIAINIIIPYFGGILLICSFLLAGGMQFKEKHENAYDSSIFQTFPEHPSCLPADGIGRFSHGAERRSHATSSHCLFSGCVLCPPGSKRKWERMASQSVGKMTHWIIFCISNITLEFLPMYRYSQAASLMYLYLFMLRNASVNTLTFFFYILFTCFFSCIFFKTGTEGAKLQPTQCNSCKHNVPRFPTSIISGNQDHSHSRPYWHWSEWFWSTGQPLIFLRKEKTAQLRYVLTHSGGIFSPLSCIQMLVYKTALLWSACPTLYFGRGEGNELRCERAELRPWLLGKMWTWSL